MKPKKTSAKKKVVKSLRPKPAVRAKTKVMAKEVKPSVTKVPSAKAKVTSPAPPKAKEVLPAAFKTKVKKAASAPAKVSAAKSGHETKPAVVPVGEPLVSKPVLPETEPKGAGAKKSAPARMAKKTSKVEMFKVKTSKPAAQKAAKPLAPMPAAAKPAPAPESKAVVLKAAESKPAVRKAPAKIPAILLEGDKPSGVTISGPGQRYALGPQPSVEKPETEGELPESYGTQQLLLAARDPHWLYAHWDLTDQQQRRYNSLSVDRHLVLRIHLAALSSRPVQEVHVHPESRHWFVHVSRAGAKYLGELGYYHAKHEWVTITCSSATLTPPDTISEDTSVEFATIPFELPMAKLLSLVKEAVAENLPLAEALQEIVAQDHPELHEITLPETPTSAPRRGSANTEWTPAQERALAEVISMDQVRRVWMGSLEITELIRRQALQELASMAAAGLGAAPESVPTSPTGALGGISSPPGGEKPSEKGFWFNVNAELIIYGATEPNASVTIAGRKIRLRPDGSFSYRFALPDGHYELPVVAISADQTDGRAAELVFSRRTELRGDVGAHQQDPELKQPEAASL